MALELNWVGESDYARVGQTRFRCYSASNAYRERFDQSVTVDGRQKAGDFLLATRDGVDVGTATAISLNMWLRGARVPCQGVAYVGTIKTQRRSSDKSADKASGERGIASAVMFETIRKARERGEVVSALMPFRASFYEHFGYGNAETRVEWTVPTAILPRGAFDGWRFYDKADDAGLLQLRSREAAVGQGDVETDAAALTNFQRAWDGGLTFVDQPAAGGPLEAYCYTIEERGVGLAAGHATLVIEDWAAATADGLRRMLHFLGSLKDQYGVVRITLPSHIPLNRMLRESQIPHRQVDHPYGVSRPYTRMQIRILDHKRLLDAMTLFSPVSGRVNVSVGECEGTTSRLAIEFDAGRIKVSPANGDADIELSDVLWASIVSGDLRASTARELGLINSTPQAATLLDAFAVGPAPFCQEYF